MGCGVPTVAYDYEITSHVGEAGAGLLAATPREFVDAVEKLANDDALRRELAAAARAAGLGLLRTAHDALRRQATRRPLHVFFYGSFIPLHGIEHILAQRNASRRGTAASGSCFVERDRPTPGCVGSRSPAGSRTGP